jgi:uncharacterized Zn-binding protein involved in type VI secretion
MPPLSSEIAQKLASYESRKVPAVKASYPVATTGARTRDGGVLSAGSSKLAVDDLAAGRVGDEVVYSGGSVAYITSGSGSAFVEGGRCLARSSPIEGSHRAGANPRVSRHLCFRNASC